MGVEVTKQKADSLHRENSFLAQTGDARGHDQTEKPQNFTQSKRRKVSKHKVGAHNASV